MVEKSATRKVQLLGALMIILILPGGGTLCQQALAGSVDTTSVPTFEPPGSIPEAIGFFASLFPLKPLQDVYQLREYIRSEEFASFRRKYGDVYSVDALFDRAMRLSWNNVYEALLISLFATMDHRRFGVELPVLGPLIWVPLTSEFQDAFRERVDLLPHNLYGDTPRKGAGDSDKLQHFFGSAFLAYLFESRSVADRIGNFIEWGEELFIVGGVSDERDVRSNRQGQEFGLRLLRDNSLRPSRFLARTGEKEGQ